MYNANVINPYFTHNRTQRAYQIFKLRHFTVSSKLLAFLKLDGSNTSQRLDGGQQKARKVSGTKKKYLEAHFITNYVN